MAYLLNSVSLSTYGIIPASSDKGNIALSGCFDMPSRTGKCFHSWAESDSIEPYVASTDIFFAGRDLTFSGFILGTTAVIKSYLDAFYTAIKAFTDVVSFATPYGTFSVYIKDVKTEMLNGGAKITILFREPIATITGTLPSVSYYKNSIDAISFLSFGLYLSKKEALYDLPELKEQLFTKYGSEGYQISKRSNKTLDFNGFIIGSSIADFQSKVSALYKIFSSAETRNIKINDEIYVECFATSGFKIDNIILYNGGVISNFQISLMAVNVNSINYLLTEAGDYILTEAGDYILV